jgi:hypothetical protein
LYELFLRLVRRDSSRAEAEIAQTKGVNDFLPFLDFLAQPFTKASSTIDFYVLGALLEPQS